MSRWEAYQSKVKTKSTQTPDTSDISRLFPFHQYFSNAPQPIFKGRTYEEDMEIAEGCFRHVKKIFTQLEVSAFYNRYSLFSLAATNCLCKKDNIFEICNSALSGDHCLLMVVIR